MKRFSLFKSLAILCGLAAAMSAVPSCNSTAAPKAAASRFEVAQGATIFSHNDTGSVNYRDCVAQGPIPERAARALTVWLEHSVVKTVSYAYPQYYVAWKDARTGQERVWGICSDDRGHMTGVLIPRDGVKAWDLPFLGNYRLYVCNRRDRSQLSEAIMTTIADAGYDKMRLQARRARGLVEEKYLVSKPSAEDLAKLKAERDRQVQETLKAADARRHDDQNGFTAHEINTLLVHF